MSSTVYSIGAASRSGKPENPCVVPYREPPILFNDGKDLASPIAIKRWPPEETVSPRMQRVIDKTRAAIGACFSDDRKFSAKRRSSKSEVA